MEPYQPSQKGCAARWIPVLVIGWILLFPAFPSAAERAGPDELFNSGKNCQSRLLDAPKRQKLRQNWNACIRNFSTLLTRYPKHPLAEKSLLGLGELYAGLYRNSRNSRDREKSRDYYRQLVLTYPDSASARTAQKRLDQAAEPASPLSVTTVQNIRHWVYPDYTRLVLDMDRDTDYRQEPSDSDVIGITLHQTRLSPAAEKGLPTLTGGLLRRVTLQKTDAVTVRVNINVKKLAKPPKIVPLSNPDRLVIDLFGRNSTGNSDPLSASNTSTNKPLQNGTAFAQALPISVQTIVIDPGHGGKDPGAIGRTGLTEKDIVLDIGLRLRRMILERLGKKVIMTRADDTFIPLDDRTLIANSKKADLFVSIHVNSHPQRTTRGVEIYHLGQSSDRHAMDVAARENNVSLKSLGNLERTVKQILFDLGREYNTDQSQTLAHFTRRSFQTTLENRYDYDVVDHGVKRAPFYVLLNSNMPSILAEVSFISNPMEEQLLRQGPYRQAIAESLFQGIRTYLTALKPVS